VGRIRDEALTLAYTHVVFPVCLMAIVALWMGFFYLLDMVMPTKSHAGRIAVAILQIIAIVTSYGGALLAMRWLARRDRNPSGTRPINEGRPGAPVTGKRQGRLE